MTVAPATSAPAQGAVPASPTVFYDPLSYTAYDHPYEVYRQLRDEAPVYYNAERDLYVLSRYVDVKAALRNHEQMINALGNDIDGTHDSYGVGMLVCARIPPRHTALRDAIEHSFGSRRSSRWRTGSVRWRGGCLPTCGARVAGTSQRMSRCRWPSTRPSTWSGRQRPTRHTSSTTCGAPWSTRWGTSGFPMTPPKPTASRRNTSLRSSSGGGRRSRQAGTPQEPTPSPRSS